jgi:SAM-dependent methyltransferase
MPDLKSSLHLDMLREAQKSAPSAEDGIYGLHWGDPNSAGPLRIVRDRWLYPFIHPDHTALEIGPGGGRWTRYLLSFGRLICVDFHQELLDELNRNFRAPHLRLLKNNGTDLPGIEPGSIDFVFSFGVFVHLDKPIRDAYLAAIRSVLAKNGSVVIQYSDKTKKAGRDNKGFAENTPDQMRQDVINAGFVLLEENVTFLPHSAIMRFALPSSDSTWSV